MDSWFGDSPSGQQAAGDESDAPEPVDIRPDPDTAPKDSPRLLDDVTIQLEAVSINGRLLGRPDRPDTASPDAPSQQDGPVFVDSSGRRSRRFRLLGIVVCAACAVYAVVLVTTMVSGNSTAPLLPLVEQEQAQESPAEDADLSPSPDASPTGSASPSADPSASATPSTPPPNAQGDDPGPTGLPRQSTSPKPTTPSGGGQSHPATSPSAAPTTPGNDPDPTDEPDPPASTTPTTPPSPAGNAVVDGLGFLWPGATDTPENNTL
ncbi:hypothetical protein SRB5_20940 [Streptomyces sp. RB5]|uniref:Uncharacterized protein n=1 Tax=Streptomyces smaragdinus TaxID=2585196 RepID=A0A7K0CF03_9ACTN|nr:hypothetical protein [Streptomyces smaragdinus]MQY11966.1 hypothetical protein [Streptomyces smaragdinus]